MKGFVSCLINARIAAVLLFPLLLAACGMETVDTGYRGIKTSFGQVVGEPLPEGLYFYNPFTVDMYEYSVREDTWHSKTPIFTRDTQQVIVEFSVIYYPDPKQVHTIFREIGTNNDLIEKIIKPVTLGSIKDSIGEVIADDLVGKRDQVTKKALAMLKENLASRHVLVTDLQLTNFDFDDEYEKAVEDKVKAIQFAQRAKNESVQIEEQARQTVMTAKAEAEAMKIKTAALAQSRGLVEFEAIQKWDGHLPQYILGNGAMPFINLNQLGKAGKEE